MNNDDAVKGFVHSRVSVKATVQEIKVFLEKEDRVRFLNITNCYYTPYRKHEIMAMSGERYSDRIYSWDVEYVHRSDKDIAGSYTVDEALKAIAGVPERMQWDGTALYTESLIYAKHHGDVLQYFGSLDSNTGCAEAIEEALDRYKTNISMALAQTRLAYKDDRIAFVVASHIRRQREDPHISPKNKAWAMNVSVPHDGSDVYYSLSKADPELLELFAVPVGEEWERAKAKRLALIAEMEAENRRWL